MHSTVDDSGSILPEQGTVFWVEDQSSVKNIEEKHDFISPGKLAWHAQEHLLQELDPQAFLKSVQAKELLPGCENMKQQETELAPHQPCQCGRAIKPKVTAVSHLSQLQDVKVYGGHGSQHNIVGPGQDFLVLKGLLPSPLCFSSVGKTGQAFSACCC